MAFGSKTFRFVWWNSFRLNGRIPFILKRLAHFQQQKNHQMRKHQFVKTLLRQLHIWVNCLQLFFPEISAVNNRKRLPSAWDWKMRNPQKGKGHGNYLRHDGRLHICRLVGCLPVDPRTFSCFCYFPPPSLFRGFRVGDTSIIDHLAPFFYLSSTWSRDDFHLKWQGECTLCSFKLKWIT